MKETDKAFIAGMIEGDGHIGLLFSKRKNNQGVFYSRIIISGRDNKLMDYCFKLLNRGRFVKIERGTSRGVHIKITKHSDIIFLLEKENLIKYLVSKRKIADLLLKFCKSRLENYNIHSEYSVYEKSLYKQFLEYKRRK